ncbi:MAG: hypothetical protein IMZ70_05670 [Candidatus Atribacteria bacterium]|nr:hypothetical protein [Candidatus Atribacteria bacterium]
MKQELIHKIRWLQRAEGNCPCFRSGKIICNHEYECCWSEICDVEIVKPLLKFEVIE